MKGKISTEEKRADFRKIKMSNQDRTDCHLKMFFVLRNVRMRKNSHCVDIQQDFLSTSSFFIENFL